MLTLQLAVPKRIDEAIKKLRYVDYSLLSRSSREKTAKDNESLVVKDGHIEMSAKSMDPNDESDISEIDWLAAAETVELKTFEYHGADRSDPLKAHHKNVLAIARDYSWQVACFYDRKTREFMASDPRHDPVPMNYNLVTQANITSGLAKLKITQSSSSPRFSAPAPSSFSTSSPPFQTRRFTPYNQAGRSSKSTKSPMRCFRCGVTGHLAAACDSKSTTAGNPCAQRVRRPDSRSDSLIDITTGQPFCFSWAQNSVCRFIDRCRSVHKCSLCGDGQHGANACPK